MVTCVDTSFLFSLYANDAHSSRAITWLREESTALVVTALNEFELANALRFAEYRGGIAPGQAAVLWSQFEADRTAGRVVTKICNLAAVIDDAKRISAAHTLSGGHRSFDILHVAAAVRLGAQRFLTFDRNQKLLAKAEGLAVPF
jgi:predicted nucleic acid-binding protein